MRVTAETKASTERAIRAAARKLFVRKGFNATSTRQIAAAAKVGVGTVFNYFPSKEAMAMAIAAEAFAAGRALAAERLENSGRDGAGEGGGGSLEEDLFTLVACDIRALEPIRSFVGDVLEAGLSPLIGGGVGDGGVAAGGGAGGIRTERLEAAGSVLARHGLTDAATAPVMHLYWSLYLGVLSYWAADASPKQEDTWAVLDQGVRMFAGGLRAGGRGAEKRGTIGVDDAAEVEP